MGSPRWVAQRFALARLLVDWVCAPFDDVVRRRWPAPLALEVRGRVTDDARGFAAGLLRFAVWDDADARGFAAGLLRFVVWDDADDRPRVVDVARPFEEALGDEADRVTDLDALDRPAADRRADVEVEVDLLLPFEDPFEEAAEVGNLLERELLGLLDEAF
jgi:hypothetical protein